MRIMKNLIVPKFINSGAFKNIVVSTGEVFLRRAVNSRRLFFELKETKDKVFLPEEFAIREFLQLDEENVSDLLKFQQKYGLIDSPLRPHYLIMIKKLPLSIKPIGLYGWHLPGEKEAIEITQSIRDEYCSPTPPIISIEETKVVVKNLKHYINELIAYSDGGRAITEDIRLHLITGCTILNSSFPLVTLADYEDSDKEGLGTPARIIDAVYSQMIHLLGKERGFKQCKECGSIFQYKRKGDRTLSETNAIAIYCSAECQRKHNQREQYQKRKNLQESLRC